MSKAAVHQFSAHLAGGDAIGSELLALQRLLVGAGYRSQIFVGDCDRDVAGRCSRYRDYEKSAGKNDVVVIHHSIGSDVIDYAAELPGRKLLIYHNITPAKYFVHWNPNLHRVCEHGRKQLQKLAGRVDYAFGDSEFNAEEIMAAGAGNVGVLPILYDFDGLGERPAAGEMRSGTDWLCVGRVAPNKAIEDVIRAFALYRKYYRQEAKLYLAGMAHHGERYADACRKLVDRLELEGVIFTGRINRRKLIDLYRKAAVLVSASEHEGFGVPFIEAMHFRLPILAYNSTAVAGTVGSAGIVYSEKDPLQVAALADRIAGDNTMRAALAAGADRELKRFDPQDVGEKFLAAVGRLTGEQQNVGESG